MTEGYLDEKGLYYRKNDFAPGRRNLVFVHGVTGSSSAWIKYEKYFEDRCNVLTYDLRGHGNSLKRPGYEDYSLSAHADDLCSLLRFLKISEFVLISHSYGCLIALEFLDKHPEWAEMAVFLSPDYKLTGTWRSRALWFLLLATPLLVFLPFSEKAKGRVDYQRFIGTGDWNLRRTFADVGMTGLRAYLYSLKQSLSFDRSELLGRLDLPVLILHGRQDTIFPHGCSVAMASKLKRSRLIILDNADHILVLNHFPEVSSAISVFLGEPA